MNSNGLVSIENLEKFPYVSKIGCAIMQYNISSKLSAMMQKKEG